MIIHSFKHTNFLSYIILIGQQDKKSLSLKAQHLIPDWSTQSQNPQAQFISCPGGSMTGGRWGSEWREGEKGTGLEQHGSFCLEESLGLLFPATWLARYSGILSHYKISRRNNNSAFSVLTGSKGNHQGAKQNKNNTLNAPNSKPPRAREDTSTQAGIQSQHFRGDWAMSLWHHQGAESETLGFGLGHRGSGVFLGQHSSRSQKKQCKSSLEENFFK